MAKSQDLCKRQHRSNITPIHSLFDQIRGNLTGSHRKVMKNTPFKHLFNALDKNQLQNSRRKNETLDVILFCYDKEHKAFKFGNGLYKPTKLDVKLIFGIEDGKEDVQDMVYREHDAPDLATRLFPGAKRPTQSMIKAKVEVLVRERNQTAIEDTVRLLCLLLFQSIFFSNTGQTFPWGFLYFVADFERLNSYDWSEHIISELYKGLNDEWDDPTQVNGCTVLLLYWFCEHCRDIYEAKRIENMKRQGKKKKKNYPIQIPRILKWEMCDLERVFKDSKEQESLTKAKESFNGDELIPTLAEKKLIPSLKDMKEVDELSVSGEPDNEQEHQQIQVEPASVADIETESQPSFSLLSPTHVIDSPTVIEKDKDEQIRKLCTELELAKAKIVEFVREKLKSLAVNTKTTEEVAKEVGCSLMGSQLEEKNKKIAELEQEVLRMQQVFDAERIDYKTRLDQEAAAKMELTSQLKNLEAENKRLTDVLAQQEAGRTRFRSILRPPGQEARQPNRHVTFNVNN